MNLLKIRYTTGQRLTLIYNYNNAESVIQEDDEDEGRIIGKGLFDDVHVGFNIASWYFDMYHILRVDVKEGRARILITLTEYHVLSKDLDGNIGSDSDYPIASAYPIEPKGSMKTMYGKAFYNSHLRAQQTINQMHDAILKGNTSEQFAGDDW